VSLIGNQLIFDTTSISNILINKINKADISPVSAAAANSGHYWDIGG